MKKVKLHFDENEASILLEMLNDALKTRGMEAIDNVKYFKDKFLIAFNAPDPKEEKKKGAK